MFAFFLAGGEELVQPHVVGWGWVPAGRVAVEHDVRPRRVVLDEGVRRLHIEQVANRRIAEAAVGNVWHVGDDGRVDIDLAGTDECPAEQGRDRLGDAEHQVRLVVANAGSQPFERNGIALDRDQRVRFGRSEVFAQYARARRAVEGEFEQIACGLIAECARVLTVADPSGGNQLAHVSKRPACVGWLHPIGKRGAVHFVSMVACGGACEPTRRFG